MFKKHGLEVYKKEEMTCFLLRLHALTSSPKVAKHRKKISGHVTN